MKELVEFIFKSLATKPKAVEVSQEVTNGIVNLVVKVDVQDMGLVIGRRGNTIKAIRVLVKTRALAEKKKVQLTLEETKKQKD